ncbi:MAG: hypothetical protein ACI8XZ_005650 [Gammaproteobacteria bacterium]|jgi:hypothetical protein
MNCDAICRVAELLGATGAIITLGYLALQIRQGNQTGNRDSYRAWVSDMNNGLFVPQLDPDFNQVFQQANRDWDSIPPHEQGRVNAVYSHLMFMFQEGFAQRERGETDEHLARQQDIVAATMLQMPGMATWWERAAHFFSPTFCDHIQECLDSEDCPQALQNVFPWYLGESSVRPDADSAVQPPVSSCLADWSQCNAVIFSMLRVLYRRRLISRNRKWPSRAVLSANGY